MNHFLTTAISRQATKCYLFDLFALLFVFIAPGIGFRLGVPLYLIEPMRLMVILALVHTQKPNAFLLAIILPWFSVIVSGHPPPVKAGLMMSELLINVVFFLILLKKTDRVFLSMLAAIVFSKLIYYLLKYVCIYAGWLAGELYATEIYAQVLTTVTYSLYVFIVYRISKL
ncbi:MAG: hypothetical protein KJ607_12575 [Bacteroidetes bacterium]|nr:hypothetical protein [Bacteroidota bacterium]